MFLLAKYGVQTTFTFPVVKRAVVDLAATADWTPATGDAKVSKDAGSVANTTNNPAAVAGTGSVMWSLVLTATELTAAVVDVQIVDSATKAIEDQVLKVYTYGNASAKIPFDLSTAALTAAAIADGVLDRDMSTGTDSGSPTVRTVRQALRFLRNKWSISGSTLSVMKEDDATNSWTATVTATPGANPITGNDPA